jgi:formyl-CoA transferase
VAGPFDDIRVIDATHVLAGPFCTYQLALLGADVIRVERIDEGDFIRRHGADPVLNAAGMGTSFLGQNANKRSLSMNLKAPEGRELFHRLVADADVVVENFRPGVMGRLGLGFEDLTRINDSLVYCSITGFGQLGPLSHLPAYDHMMQAVAGLMSLSGDESAPRRVGFPLIDYVAGLIAAHGIGAALYERQHRKEPRHIDVSMLEAAFALTNAQVAECLVTGGLRPRSGTTAFSGSPFSGVFETADGMLSVAANTLEQAIRLCRVVGREDLVDDPRLADWEDHPELAGEVAAILEAAFRTLSAQAWETRLNDAGVPAGKVRTLPEILRDPQVEALGTVRDAGFVDAIGRRVDVPGAGLRFDGESPAVTRPPPALGQHTDEVLQEIGVDEQARARLRERGIIR